MKYLIVEPSPLPILIPLGKYSGSNVYKIFCSLVSSNKTKFHFCLLFVYFEHHCSNKVLSPIIVGMKDFLLWRRELTLHELKIYSCPNTELITIRNFRRSLPPVGDTAIATASCTSVIYHTAHPQC